MSVRSFGAMVAENLREWQSHIWFTLRPTPCKGEAMPTLCMPRNGSLDNPENYLTILGTPLKKGKGKDCRNQRGWKAPEQHDTLNH